jgi:Raf kinase inhibitor-like YbhB/YbcL family protein
MFRRTTRQSPFWPAAALLALLAAPHTLLAQDAPQTIRTNVTNRTEKDIEFTLVGPDGKALGNARTVKPGYVYRTNPRDLPGGSAKEYKWVVRDPATKKVLQQAQASADLMIVVGTFRVGAGTEVAKESRLAFVTNRTAKPVELALVGPDGKDVGPARSVEPSEVPYRTSARTLPEGSARGYKWVIRNPATKKVLKDVPAEWSMQSITVGGARPADSGSAQTPEKKGQGAARRDKMTLSGNFNNGKFKRSQLSPRVKIKDDLGNPVGQDATPNMTWKAPPKGTKSFALVMEDISVNPANDTSPDPPGKYTHWVVYNIPKDVLQLSGAVVKGATVGTRYEGPNPPKGEKHTYVFTLYALNTDKLTLGEGVTAEAMRTATQGRTIGRPAEVRVKFGY